MKHRKFCVFILSHGRPNNVITLKSLRESNYTGDWYIVCDTEDDTLDDYIKLFGKDKILIFDKLETSKTFDTFDNFDNRKTIVYARNKCFDLAKELGYDYFLELDDDYTSFEFRKMKKNKLAHIKCKQLDKLFDIMLDFLDTSGASTVCMAQGGDFFGGNTSAVYLKRCTRKAMNTFFCRTDKPFKFIGRINEDVNTYTCSANKGLLMLTVADVNIQQSTTQSNKGGMTETYIEMGTYMKSFYTIICSPQAVKIATMGVSEKRIHHRINWDRCTPCIVSDRYKK